MTYGNKELTNEAMNERLADGALLGELLAGDALFADGEPFAGGKLLADNRLTRFKNDHLVEVFRIWDCYAQDWIANSPTLLRFESDDAVVHVDTDGAIDVIVGPVDTMSAITFDAEGSTALDAAGNIAVNEGSAANTAKSAIAGGATALATLEAPEDVCLCWLRVNDSKAPFCHTNSWSQAAAESKAPRKG